MSENLDAKFNSQHIITVLEQHIQLQHNDFAVAESKAQSHIATTAVVMSITSAFSLLGGDINWFGYIMLMLAGASLVWVMWWSLRALTGQKMMKAMDGSKENHDSWLLFLKYPEKYQEKIIELYRGILEHNEKVVSDKLMWANKAIWGLYSQLVFILLLVVSLVLGTTATVIITMLLLGFLFSLIRLYRNRDKTEAIDDRQGHELIVSSHDEKLNYEITEKNSQEETSQFDNQPEMIEKDMRQH